MSSCSDLSLTKTSRQQDLVCALSFGLQSNRPLLGTLLTRACCKNSLRHFCLSRLSLSPSLSSRARPHKIHHKITLTMTMMKSMLASPILLIIIAAIASSSTAFIIQPSRTTTYQITSPSRSITSLSPSHHPSSLSPNRRLDGSHAIRSNSSSTQLHSLFGLGPAELAIIGIAAIFLIGPSKLTEFTRSAGEVAGKEAAAWKELKNIPEEFQKGLEEGEIEGRSRKAKVMEKVDEEE